MRSSGEPQRPIAKSPADGVSSSDCIRGLSHAFRVLKPNSMSNGGVDIWPPLSSARSSVVGNTCSVQTSRSFQAWTSEGVYLVGERFQIDGKGVGLTRVPKTKTKLPNVSMLLSRLILSGYLDSYVTIHC